MDPKIESGAQGGQNHEAQKTPKKKKKKSMPKKAVAKGSTPRKRSSEGKKKGKRGEPNATISVNIYNDGRNNKRHWAVDVQTSIGAGRHLLHATYEDPGDAEKGFKFENRRTDGETSKRLESLESMCEVPESKVALIDELAKQQPSILIYLGELLLGGFVPFVVVFIRLRIPQTCLHWSSMNLRRASLS